MTLGSKIPLVSSAWAKTSDLIQHGGSAVEGIIFSSTYNKESKHKNFVIFKKQFKERFGKIPDFSAVFSYEAAQLLFYGLSTTDEVEKLKDTIINRQIYPGLQGDIQIDKYGDVKRKRFLITVKDGQFITLE